MCVATSGLGCYVAAQLLRFGTHNEVHTPTWRVCRQDGGAYVTPGN